MKDVPSLITKLYGVSNSPRAILLRKYELNLKTYIKRNERLALKDIFQIILNLSKSLSCLHSKGVIHGCLNPYCIFVENKNDEVIAVVGDFSCSYSVENGPINQGRFVSKNSLPCLKYLAPEIYERKEENISQTQNSNIIKSNKLQRKSKRYSSTEFNQASIEMLQKSRESFAYQSTKPHEDRPQNISDSSIFKSGDVYSFSLLIYELINRDTWEW